MTAKKTGGKTAPKKKAPAKKTASTKAKTQKTAAAKPVAEKKVVAEQVVTPDNSAAALIATLFSTGRVPFAPGTWGSLWGVFAFPLFTVLPLAVAQQYESVLFVAVIWAALITLVYTAGVISVRQYQEKTGKLDAPEIVIDEFFGQILTYSLIVIIYYGLYLWKGGSVGMNMGAFDKWLAQLIPFAMFRLFDIWKPWPVSVADRRKDAHGVMLDDAVAAVYASIFSVLVFVLIYTYII